MSESRFQKAIISGITAASIVCISEIAQDYNYAAELARQAEISCYDPSAADYAALDESLNNIEPAPRHKMTAADSLETFAPQIQDLATTVPQSDDVIVQRGLNAFQDAAHQAGASIYYGSFAESLGAAIEPHSLHNYSAEDIEQDKPEIYRTISVMTSNYYGFELGLLDKEMVLGGPANGPAEKQTLAIPVSIDEIQVHQLIALGEEITTTPAELVKQSGLTKLVLYRSKADNTGLAVTGTVRNGNTIYLDINSPGNWSHELGHLLDDASCMSIFRDPRYTALHGDLPLYDKDPRQDPVTSLDTYTNASLFMARDVLAQDGSNTMSFEEAKDQVDQKYAEVLVQVPAVSEYHTNPAEDKAEVHEAIFENRNLNYVLNHRVPIIAAKTRLLLARLRHLDPEATDFLIETTFTPPTLNGPVNEDAARLIGENSGVVVSTVNP